MPTVSPCKICSQPTEILWTKKVLNRHAVTYHHCGHCGFVGTEEPYWLDEAYTDAIADMDTGILERNLKQRAVVPLLIRLYFNRKARFVDFGGGYGLFVRFMRDKGLDFFWTDRYASNLFARKFVAEKPDSPQSRYELLTAFEVMEHLPDPIQAVEDMLEWSDSVLFTTLLLPKAPVEEIRTKGDWWYWTFETGQHVSIFSEESLAFLAKKKGLHFHTNGKNLHLFTRKKGGFGLFGLMRILFSIRDRVKPEKSAAHADRELYKPQPV